MCGHAVIALGRYAVDHGLVTPSSPETLVRIQCPCGLITAHTEYSAGQTGAVWFESVPSFAFAIDKKIQVVCLSVCLSSGYLLSVRCEILNLVP